MIDFGTDAGQANPLMAPGGSFSVGGGYGFNANLSRTRSFGADAVSINYTAASTASYSGGGEQYSGTYFRGLAFSGADLASKLKVESRVITGATIPTFSEFRLMFTAVDGSTSTYHLKTPASATTAAPLSFGTDPAAVPFSVVESIAVLGSPNSSSATFGAFDWSTDTLNQVDVYFKSGVTNAGGTFSWEIDNIQVTVPEPTMMSLLGVGSILALRRRKA